MPASLPAAAAYQAHPIPGGTSDIARDQPCRACPHTWAGPCSPTDKSQTARLVSVGLERMRIRIDRTRGSFLDCPFPLHRSDKPLIIARLDRALILVNDLSSLFEPFVVTRA